MSKEYIIKVLDEKEISEREAEAEIQNDLIKTCTFKKVVVSPYENMGELIRCKDCKHRPVINGEYENGFDLGFPTNKCPCQCDDGYYSWMPKDDWYCPNGERKEE